MKIFSLLMVVTAALLGGCASTDNAQSTAEGGSSYVSLGSNIPKKNGKPADGQAADLQQLENARIQNGGVMNGQGSR